MRVAKIILAFAATFCLLYGCSSGESVDVVDTSGNPIEGASVQVVSPPTGNAPTLTIPSVTDGKGQATVPVDSDAEKTTWVIVSKPGYKPAWIGAPVKWPLHVTLHP